MIDSTEVLRWVTHMLLAAIQGIAECLTRSMQRISGCLAISRIAWPKAEEASRALAQLPERKGGPCVSTVSSVSDSGSGADSEQQP